MWRCEWATAIIWRAAQSVFEEQDGSDDDNDEEETDAKTNSTLKEFIPQSIIDFMLE
jgi:hypothetical protein